MNEQTKLPDGKTCSDCLHLEKCVSLFGGDAGRSACDFFPSRFVDRAQAQDGYAVVELIGRQLIAGKVSDAPVDGVPCIRVDVPETRVHKAYTCWFQASAVYAIKPIGEAQAMNITTMRERGRFGENGKPGEVQTSLSKEHSPVTSKGRRVR